MRRVSIGDALVGQPASGSEGVQADGSHEAVVLSVRGGEVVAVVPVGTPDEAVEGAASVVRGRLRLENERVLSFEVRPGTGGCAFEDWSSELHPQREHAGAGVPAAEGSAQGPSSTAASGAALGTAADVMSRNVVTVSRDMLVEDAAKLLAFHSISGMPVEDWDGKVVGIVSEADVIGKIGDTVDDVMTREVISVPDTATIEEIAALMADKRIKRVPVMSNGALLGMISRADIVRALAARA